jgi:hypothetical protein
MSNFKYLGNLMTIFNFRKNFRVNYHGIFITLAPGVNVIKLFIDVFYK